MGHNRFLTFLAASFLAGSPALADGVYGPTNGAGTTYSWGWAEAGANHSITSLDGVVFKNEGDQLCAGTAGVGVRDCGNTGIANYIGNVPPGPTNGSNQGYGVSSFGVVGNVLYVCQDATPFAAIWIAVSSVALATYAGSGPPTTATDGPHGYSNGSPGVDTSMGRAFMLKSNTENNALWEADGIQTPLPALGNWALLDGQGVPVASTAVGSTTTIVLSLIRIPEARTMSAAATKIVAIGSSNIQIAFYNASATTNLPTTEIGNTLDIVDTGTGVANGGLSPNLSFPAPGLYWVAEEVNDVTVAFAGPNSGLVAQYVGSAALGDLALGANANVVNCITTTTSAYGTWPADLTSSTFTFLNNSNKCGIVFGKWVSAP